MPRKKLLFLSQCLPFPANSGVRIRTFNVMRILSKEYDVRSLCFFRRAGQPTDAAVQYAEMELRKFGSTRAFPIPQEHSVFRKVWDHLRSLAVGRVYTYYAYQSKAFTDALLEEIELHRPDIIHIDSLDLVWALERLPSSIPVVVCHHNFESALLQRRSEMLRGYKRLYLSYQAKLMQAAETKALSRADLTVMVSDVDCQSMQRLNEKAKIIVVPNGVDVTEYASLPDAESGIVFVGSTSWFPNLDARNYFLEEILPEIRKRVEGVRVFWVGHCPDAEREILSSRYNVHLTGFVESIEPYVRQSACYVSPIRVGGGTRLKILCAWSMGRAVVSTSIGCEGLDAVDGKNIMIADTPDSFADAVARVLLDPDLRIALASEGRRTAESIYDWEAIGRSMLEQYRAVIA